MATIGRHGWMKAAGALIGPGRVSYATTWGRYIARTGTEQLCKRYFQDRVLWSPQDVDGRVKPGHDGRSRHRPINLLMAPSGRDPSRRNCCQYEGGCSDISHPCRPILAMLNRKAEQEWNRKEKENDVTQDEAKIVHAGNSKWPFLLARRRKRAAEGLRRAQRSYIAGRRRQGCENDSGTIRVRTAT